MKRLGLAMAVLSLVLSPPSLVSGAVRLRAVPCGPNVTQPLVEPPWGLTRLRPDLAWPLTKGAGVVVAVIDSGVSADHPSLAGQVLRGTDFVDANAGPGQCDENGHGTLIAGIIAGRDTVSGGYQFHGVAPEASILPVRVLRDQQRSFEADLSDRIADAVTWAVDRGSAGVVNLSLTTVPTPRLEESIRHALARGVVVVAAAGNEGGTSQAGAPIYPAAYDGVIGVAGVDLEGKHVNSSSAGSWVDVAAPGVRIAGPSPTGGGFLFSADGGTSFAAAYVSGLAALVRAYRPELSPDQVARRITETAEHPAHGWDSQLGYGLIDPVRAVGSLGVVAAPPTGPARHVDPPAAAFAAESRLVLAAWIAAGGALVALVVLLGVPMVRRGRGRRWRAGPL